MSDIDGSARSEDGKHAGIFKTGSVCGAVLGLEGRAEREIQHINVGALYTRVHVCSVAADSLRRFLKDAEVTLPRCTATQLPVIPDLLWIFSAVF